MRVRNEEEYSRRKNDIMEKCFACYAERGLGSVGMKELAKACGFSAANLYTYFRDLDDLIIQATSHCMKKVEDDFMERAPTDVSQLKDYIEKIPYWNAQEHGSKYRLMYQIYTQPKYHEYGKLYFEGINQRYSTYGRKLEKILDIPADIITPLIFIFVRACVHYALFEDEYYLQAQLGVLKKGISMYLSQIKPETKEEHQP